MLAPRSLTLRLTLLFALVATSALLLLGALVGLLVEKHFVELDRDTLKGKSELIRHMLASVHTKADFQELPKRLRDSLVGHEGLYLSIWQKNGSPLFELGGGVFPSSMHSHKAVALTTWSITDGQSFRGFSELMPLQTPEPSTVVVALATDLAHHEHFMGEFKKTLWSAVFLTVLVTGGLSWAAARRGLAPLHEITQRVASITATELDRRLPEDSLPAELAEVGRTLNEMLARLEAAFQRLSDFSADIAHELRTPLNNMLIQTQVSLGKARTEEVYRDILASNVEELERLSRMVADMLFLAKSDNHLALPQLAEVNLKTEVEALAEFFDALAEAKNVRINTRGTALVMGDNLMLRRALANLISNALQHAAPQSIVLVELSTQGLESKIRVENQGTTIAPEHLPRLFDRFYRADASRQRHSDGSGLGLAITHSIIQAHGGRLGVESADGITRFTITLPSGKIRTADIG